MEVFDKCFKEMFSSQLVSIIGGLIAGVLLAVYIDKLFLIPGMLILIPGFLETRGNVSGSMAARLTSGMYLGVVKVKKIRSKFVRGNVLASFVLAMAVSLVLGIVAFVFSFIALGIFVPKIIIIPVLAAILANIIEVPLTVFFTFYLFRKGHDPNNIMGPFVTSTGDITSIVSLLLVVLLI
ncbi:MAG: magnesium transporter [Candidatus Aenigmatarchaeota archaeon]